MKIGLITYGSLDTTSGGSIYNRMMVERLQQEGDEVENIVLPWQNYALRLADNLAEEWFERLREAPFDLLLQDESCHPSLFRVNRRLRSRVKYPIVAVVHHLHSADPRSAWPTNRFYREIEQRYLGTVDGFIFGSQAIRCAAMRMVGDKRPALVAYPAGDRLRQAASPKKIARRACANGPLRVLFSDDLSPCKGLHILIDALTRLEPSTWHLTIAGSTAVDRTYARSIADRLRRDQLLDGVAHVGLLDGIRLSRCYASSHVLAAPSTCEEFGVSQLEGMGFGLPLVIGVSDAASEIVTHGVDSFLIPPGDVDALAGHLQTLNADRDKLLAMSLAALARFGEHPTWLQSTGAIVQFLHNFPETIT
jgi:glycosyltransferase involved in cell wall biosynthesis